MTDRKVARLLIVIDIEATCWDANISVANALKRSEMETIEIGAVCLTDDGRRLGEFQTFCKPTLNPILSDFCRSLTSIRQEQVDAAPLFRNALDAFRSWGKSFVFPEISGNKFPEWVTMVSWGEYDVKQLKQDCRRSGTAFPFSRHVNIKSKFRDVFGANLKNSYLGTATEHLSIPWEGTAHRGIDDVRMEAKVLERMLQLNYQINEREIRLV